MDESESGSIERVSLLNNTLSNSETEGKRERERLRDGRKERKREIDFLLFTKIKQ